MRVPNVLQGDSVFSQLDRIRTDLNRASDEIATGKRVSRPSDDPVAASRASRIQGRLETLDHYREQTSRAESELLAVDLVLDDLEKLMDQAATSAAAARSGTETPESFQALAIEIDGIRDEMFRLANSRHNGTYLFAGRQTLAPAFADSGGVISYQGDGVAPTARVSDQAVVETTIPGDGIFVTGLDVFQVLGDLRDAVAAGDTDAAGVEAANVETVTRRFSQFRARAGFTLEELGRHRTHLSSETAQEQIQLGQEVDADLVDAISRMGAANTNLQAALGAGGRLLSVSLFDVIG